jgi:hypothetical protein
VKAFFFFFGMFEGFFFQSGSKCKSAGAFWAAQNCSRERRNKKTRD